VIAVHMLPLQFANAGELEDAIVAGDQAQVEALLARGVQANDPMDINGSPLHLAAAYGFAGIVKICWRLVRTSRQKIIRLAFIRFTSLLTPVRQMF
jgi:hypothetical protein